MVVGRSNIVGKPMAQLLLQRNATVTLCHSRNERSCRECSQADVLVAAVGKPEASWVKPNAVVIDVGINRVEMNSRGCGLKRYIRCRMDYTRT